MAIEGELIQLEVGRVVENKWKVEKKLGEGAFGAVYKVSKDGQLYALKVEGVNEQLQMLKMEVFVLTELSRLKLDRHFCQIEDKGQHANFNYVVMTYVGKSLQNLLNERPRHSFSMGTALGVGIKCLEALEDLHSIGKKLWLRAFELIAGLGYLHRDVKPGNYTIGRAAANELRRIYVLDFGMTRRFIHDDGTIKKPRAAAGFRGTVKYAPLSCHMQRELCRKDDCESWLYMLVEITVGKLPWRNMKEINQVGLCKKNCRKDLGLRQLFGGCPREYIEVLQSIDACRFFDAPDYDKIYKLLRKAMESTKSEELPYDWEEKQQTKTTNN
ncbi:Protein kinase domain containing protein [Aphelenchoides avenae]|nr:Protein kinase domain containing protein [Aphelenchus avenae]